MYQAVFGTEGVEGGVEVSGSRSSISDSKGPKEASKVRFFGDNSGF